MSALLLPLDQIAHEINVRLQKAEVADDHRIAAGKLLLEARDRVDAGEAINDEGVPFVWGMWCNKFLKGRSARDIRKVIALVKSDDPVAAREEERQRNREDKYRERIKRSDVRPADYHKSTERPYVQPVSQPVTVDPPWGLAAIQEAVMDLSKMDLAAFAAWFKSYATTPDCP